MPKTLTFTTTSTGSKVKPTQTTFVNNTDKAITLAYSSGNSPPVPVNGTTQTSNTISGVNYGSSLYYFAGPDYTILANKTVPVTKSGGNLVMTVP